MKQMKSLVRTVVLVALVVVVVGFVLSNWSFVFAKTVHGKILNVQRVTDPSAVFGSKLTPEQMHSYAVLIQGDDGRLYTSSSEDRQWQVATPGYCVKAKLYRYPPWDLERANTFFNARVEELKLCDGQTSPPQPPAQNSAPEAEKPAPPAEPAK